MGQRTPIYVNRYLNNISSHYVLVRLRIYILIHPPRRSFLPSQKNIAVVTASAMIPNRPKIGTLLPESDIFSICTPSSVGVAVLFPIGFVPPVGFSALVSCDPTAVKSSVSPVT